MRPAAWLVSVARGRHMDTGAPVGALRSRAIGRAALDLTGAAARRSPAVDLGNAIITPHAADTPEMIRRMLAARIGRNVSASAAGAAWSTPPPGIKPAWPLTRCDLRTTAGYMRAALPEAHGESGCRAC